MKSLHTTDDVTRFIYALADPRSGSVRYIGVTVDKATRMYGHVSSVLSGNSQTPRAKWIRELIDLGLRPVMTIIESVYGKEWRSREKFWIAHYRKLGDILNVSAGGDGGGNLIHGRKFSEETRARMTISRLRKYRNYSDEQLKELFYTTYMKAMTPKPIKKIIIKPSVKKSSSKPKPTLSKSDPNYYSKIGTISAARRKLDSEYFSEMARLSHGKNSKRDGYHGGRKKKDAD